MTTMHAKTLKSKLLGTLRYEKEFNWWTAKFVLGKGHRIDVTINDQEDMDKVVVAVVLYRFYKVMCVGVVLYD